MKRSDRYYLEARAEEEIEKAQQSCDPRAVASHYYLAELYLKKLHGSEQEAGFAGALHS